MTLSSADGARCPACGKRVTYYGEVELSNGYKLARYVIKCKACGYREVLQEVVLKKRDDGITVEVVKLPSLRGNKEAYRHARKL